MTTTINDISDLARILEEHPEWAETLRSLLLTREMLDLPTALARLTELVNDFIREQRETNQRADERLARLTELVNDFIREQRETNQRADERLANLEGRVTHLEEIGVNSDQRLARLEEAAASSDQRLTSLTELVNDFIREQRETNQRADERLARLEEAAASSDQRLTSLTELVNDFIREQRETNQEQRETNQRADQRLTSLETISRRMQGQIGWLLGAAAERRLQGHLDVVLSQRLNLRRAVTLKSINLGIDRGLAEQLEEAQDNRIITPEQHLQVRLVDVILSAVDRETAAPVYIAAEVSLTLNRNDIARAAERAAILEKATGVATIAAVVGGRIPPLQETQAAAAGVHIVLMEDLDIEAEGD